MNVKSLIGPFVFAMSCITPCAFAHWVSNAKAAELSLHRLERLVILRRVDAEFQTKMKELKLEKVSAGGEEFNFNTVNFQYPAADGTQKNLEIVLNDDGRATSYKENAGGPAVGAPVWPDKDSVTLAERALHFVQDQSGSPDIAPYNDKMTRQRLWQETNALGEAIAVSDITIDERTDILRVRIKANGDYLSYELVKQTL